MDEALRLLVAAVVIALLARTVRPAWRQRALVVRIWRSVRPRHVLGSLVLLVAVLTVALTLAAAVPPTRLGLGSLVGFTGNAVFAPVEEVSVRAGGSGLAGQAAPEPGGRWTTVAVAVPLLLWLLLLVPWLAHGEERLFREGLEDANPAREVWTALRFGLIHLVMLVPLAAALAIAVAGFAYGRSYRRAFRRAAARREPVPGPLGGVPVAPPRSAVRAEAVMASTTLHATFNALVILVVLAALVADAAL